MSRKTGTIDTKAALLASAERAARQNGFDGFSYADLANDVGIRKASIHHHFPTKAALSVEMMKQYRDGTAAACREIDAAHDLGAAQLNALMGHYRSALNDGSSLCLCVALSASRESLSEEALREIRGFRAMMIEWISGAFEKAKFDGTVQGVADETQEAAAMLSLLEGAQLAARAEGQLKPFDAATALLRARLSI